MLIWNHRDLSDPIQESIECIIKDNIDDYAYGTRREDQTTILEESNLFSSIDKRETGMGFNRFYTWIDDTSNPY